MRRVWIRVWRITTSGFSRTENDMTIEPATISVKKAAEISSFGERTIWRMIKNGEIESCLTRNRRLIPYASFKAFLEGLPAE